MPTVEVEGSTPIAPKQTLKNRGKAHGWKTSLYENGSQTYYPQGTGKDQISDLGPDEKLILKAKRLGLCLPLESLTDYGTGLLLYFTFLKRMAFYFLCATCVVLPMVFFQVYNIYEISERADAIVDNPAGFQSTEEGEVFIDYVAGTALHELDEDYSAAKAMKEAHTSPSIANILFFTSLGNAPLHMTVERRKLVNLLMVLGDMAYTWMFLAFVFWMRKRQGFEGQWCEETLISAADYTVQVSNLPKNTDKSKDADTFVADLSQKLTEFCEGIEHPGRTSGRKNLHVREISVALNNGKMLHLYTKKAKENLKLEKTRYKVEKLKSKNKDTTKAEAKMSKANDKVVEIDEDLAKLAKKQEGNIRPICAFVTFHRDGDVEKFLELYGGFWHHLKLLILCGKNKPPKFVYPGQKGRYPKVKRAAEPSNVLFQNFEIGAPQRFARQILSIFILITILGLSFGIIYLCKLAQLSQMLSVSECYDSYNPYNETDPKFSDFEQTQIERGLQGGYDDWCVFSDPEIPIEYQQSPAWPSFELPEDWEDEVENWGECAEYCFCNYIGGSEASVWCQLGMGKEKFLATLPVIAVVAVNQGLKAFLKGLAKFEKRLSVSEQESVIARNVFFAQFLNTALIVFMVQSSMFASAASSYLEKIGAADDPDFSEFDIQWYITVGAAIVVTLVTNALVPKFIIVGLWLKQKIWTTCCGCLAVTAQDWEKLYEGQKVDLSDKYSQILTSIFCCLLFSSGMPILMLVGCIDMFTFYWADKFQLLKFARRPPQFDDTLSVFACNFVPWALILHCFGGIWVYSKKTLVPGFDFRELFGQENNTALYSFTTEDDVLADDAIDTEQLFNINIVIMGFTLAVVVVILVLDAVVRATVGKALGQLCKRKSSQVAPSDATIDELPPFEDEKNIAKIANQGTITTLGSVYNFKEQPEYKYAFSITSPIKTPSKNSLIGGGGGGTTVVVVKQP